MAQRVWIIYDLGVDGDYEGLYAWLDSNKAVECGSGGASFLIQAPANAVFEFVKKSLKHAVTLRSRDRIYVVCRDVRGKWLGKFMFGGRKRAPWIGYAAGAEATIDEG